MKRGEFAGSIFSLQGSRNMKKVTALIVLIFAIATGAFAQLSERSDITTSERGHFVLERKQEKDGLASFDKILCIKDEKTTVLFDSEGRHIQRVIKQDMDGDSVPEILILMDLGGSGAFKEIALLKRANDKYDTIWEETGFVAGTIAYEDRDGKGKKYLFIDYTNTEVKPEKPATAKFSLINGELKRLK